MVRRNIYQLTRPPRILQKAKLDNLTLMPANLLPFKAQYQRLANSLPNGGVLIILPVPVNKSRIALETVSAHLKDQGYRITTISATEFADM